MKTEKIIANINYGTENPYRVEVSTYDITNNCITIYYIDPRTGTQKKLITSLNNVILEFYYEDN